MGFLSKIFGKAKDEKENSSEQEKEVQKVEEFITEIKNINNAQELKDYILEEGKEYRRNILLYLRWLLEDFEARKNLWIGIFYKEQRNYFLEERADQDVYALGYKTSAEIEFLRYNKENNYLPYKVEKWNLIVENKEEFENFMKLFSANEFPSKILAWNRIYKLPTKEDYLEARKYYKEKEEEGKKYQLQIEGKNYDFGEINQIATGLANELHGPIPAEGKLKDYIDNVQNNMPEFSFIAPEKKAKKSENSLEKEVQSEEENEVSSQSKTQEREFTTKFVPRKNAQELKDYILEEGKEYRRNILLYLRWLLEDFEARKNLWIGVFYKEQNHYFLEEKANHDTYVLGCQTNTEMDSIRYEEDGNYLPFRFRPWNIIVQDKEKLENFMKLFAVADFPNKVLSWNEKYKLPTKEDYLEARKYYKEEEWQKTKKDIEIEGKIYKFTGICLIAVGLANELDGPMPPVKPLNKFLKDIKKNIPEFKMLSSSEDENSEDEYEASEEIKAEVQEDANFITKAIVINSLEDVRAYILEEGREYRRNVLLYLKWVLEDFENRKDLYITSINKLSNYHFTSKEAHSKLGGENTVAFLYLGTRTKRELDLFRGKNRSALLPCEISSRDYKYTLKVSLSEKDLKSFLANFKDEEFLKNTVQWQEYKLPNKENYLEARKYYNDIDWPKKYELEIEGKIYKFGGLSQIATGLANDLNEPAIPESNIRKYIDDVEQNIPEFNFVGQTKKAFRLAQTTEELEEMKEDLLESLNEAPSEEILELQEEIRRQNEAEEREAKKEEKDELPRLDEFLASLKYNGVVKSALKVGFNFMSQITKESKSELVENFRKNKNYLKNEAEKYSQENSIRDTLYTGFKSAINRYIKFIDGDLQCEQNRSSNDNSNESINLPRLDEYLLTRKHPAFTKSALKRGLNLLNKISDENLDELIESFKKDKFYLRNEAEKYALENSISKYTYQDFRSCLLKYLKFIDGNNLQCEQNRSSNDNSNESINLPRLDEYLATKKHANAQKSALKRGLILISKISDENLDELIESFKKDKFYLRNEAEKYALENGISKYTYQDFRGCFLQYIKFIDGDLQDSKEEQEELETATKQEPEKNDLTKEKTQEFTNQTKENVAKTQDEIEEEEFESRMEAKEFEDEIEEEEFESRMEAEEFEDENEEDICEIEEEIIQESGKKLFLSYASKDLVMANKICKNLRANGHDVWFALDSIKPGQNYAAEIVDAIENCTHIVFVLSKNSNASEHVQKELELALNCKKIMYPIRIEDFTPFGYLRYHLSTIQYVDVFDDFDGAMEIINLQLQ